MFNFLIQRLNILKNILILLFIGIFILVSGCQDKKLPNTGEDMNALTSTQEVKWQKLSEKVIFFGHQSVGENILDGINDVVRENPKINLLVKQNNDNVKMNSGTLIVHSMIGKNMEPTTKVDAFKEIMDNGMGGKANIAFMKFCYVDFNKDTDVEKVFNYYKNAMQYLKQKYPKTTFIHVTVPVEVNKGTWKTWIKNILGKKEIWEYENELPRGRYNILLRKEYEGREPIFDLALNESIYSDGKKEYFEYDGTRYPALVPEYTTDGAHLNEKGRKFIAQRLLAFLSSL